MVDDRDAEECVTPLEFDANVAASGAVLECVVDQVCERSFYRASVERPLHHRMGKVECEVHLAFCGSWRQGTGDLSDELHDVCGFRFEGVSAAFQSREIEHVLHETSEASTLPHDELVVFASTQGISEFVLRQVL